MSVMISMTISEPSAIPVVHTQARAAVLLRKERWAVALLMLCCLASSIGFTLATPFNEAPDEGGHMRYIRYMVLFDQFPSIKKDPYTHEAFQPPLYYVVCAALVKAERAITGHFPTKAVIAPNEKANPNRSSLMLFLHPPETRWLRWPYALRALSILMGLGVVLVTYLTARALIPSPASASAPLAATAFAALLPQANFIRGSISNENAGDLAGAVVIWLLALHLTKAYSRKRIVWLGIALGLGIITKSTLLPFALLVLVVLWLRRPKEGQLRAFVSDIAIFSVPVLLLAGWFYAYRWVAYGDPLGTAAWHVMSPSQVVWPDAFFWLSDTFRSMVWTSFWGVYGWQNIFMPDWVYNACTIVTLLALAGGITLAARRALNRAQLAAYIIMLAATLLMYGVIAGVSITEVVWQGREMFPALSSIAVLFGIGLAGLAMGRAAVQPVQVAHWRERLGGGLVAAFALSLLVLNIYSIVWLVIPILNQ